MKKSRLKEQIAKIETILAKPTTCEEFRTLLLEHLEFLKVYL